MGCHRCRHRHGCCSNRSGHLLHHHIHQIGQVRRRVLQASPRRGTGMERLAHQIHGQNLHDRGRRPLLSIHRTHARLFHAHSHGRSQRHHGTRCASSDAPSVVAHELPSRTHVRGGSNAHHSRHEGWTRSRSQVDQDPLRYVGRVGHRRRCRHMYHSPRSGRGERFGGGCIRAKAHGRFGSLCRSFSELLSACHSERWNLHRSWVVCTFAFHYGWFLPDDCCWLSGRSESGSWSCGRMGMHERFHCI
mmetsp:Transcript_32129/g.64004  ORF Transcript_32129/g.64004 Transcript_32129/m.64004 type:complete len:247 (+) Transcript_32129:826-1566(+)